MLPFAASQAAAQPPSPTLLHVSGSKILDGLGNEWIPHGPTVAELVWRDSLFFPADTYTTLIAQEGANVVRLPLNTCFWFSHIGYQDTVKQFIDSASAKNLYVIVDLHNTLCSSGNYTDVTVYSDMMACSVDAANCAMNKFLVSIAQAYASYPNVLYSDLGQPLHHTLYFLPSNDVLWWNVVDQQIPLIHSVNPNALILVPTLRGEQIRSYFAANPWNQPNIVYVWHKYYHWDIGWVTYATDYKTGNLVPAKMEMERDFYNNSLYLTTVSQVNNVPRPVMLIEFGANGPVSGCSAPSDPNWDIQIRDEYELLAKYGVGWTQWWSSGPCGKWQHLELHNSDLSLTIGGQIYVQYGLHGSVPAGSNPVTLKVSSNPVGLTRAVTVDGSPTTTPHAFSWAPGGGHTISAASPISCGSGCRYVFVGWSDGGAQTHVVFVPASAVTYTAKYQKQFFLTVASSRSGSGTANPTPASGGWDNAGASVTLTATATSGHHFVRWVGSGPGSYTGTAVKIIIIVRAPVTETAEFS